MIVNGFRAALDLDTYPLSNLIRPRCAERAKRGRGKPVLIMHIGFFACFHAISLERSRFSKMATLFSCPCSTEDVGRHVACSPRIVVDRQTDRQTESLHSLYIINPRRVCAARVTVVVLCVCLSVSDYSRTTGCEAANERY